MIFTRRFLFCFCLFFGTFRCTTVKGWRFSLTLTFHVTGDLDWFHGAHNQLFIYQSTTESTCIQLTLSLLYKTSVVYTAESVRYTILLTHQTNKDFYFKFWNVFRGGIYVLLFSCLLWKKNVVSSRKEEEGSKELATIFVFEWWKKRRKKTEFSSPDFSLRGWKVILYRMCGSRREIQTVHINSWQNVDKWNFYKKQNGPHRNWDGHLSYPFKIKFLWKIFSLKKKQTKRAQTITSMDGGGRWNSDPAGCWRDVRVGGGGN